MLINYVYNTVFFNKPYHRKAIVSVTSKNILVFDSGIGGFSVLQTLFKLMPQYNYSYCSDNQALPYGDKPDTYLRARIIPLFRQLIEQCQPDIAVIACNTASTLLLDQLREYFNIPFIGVVPAIKPAGAISQSKHIALLATAATTEREYINHLHQKFASDCTLLRFACGELVTIAEEKLLNGKINQNQVNDFVKRLLHQSTEMRQDFSRIDTIVLGCTHFSLLLDELKQAWPDSVNWLDSSEAIARRCQQLMSRMDNTSSRPCRTLFTSSISNSQTLLALLKPYNIEQQSLIEIND